MSETKRTDEAERTTELELSAGSINERDAFDQMTEHAKLLEYDLNKVRAALNRLVAAEKSVSAPIPGSITHEQFKQLFNEVKESLDEAEQALKEVPE